MKKITVWVIFAFALGFGIPAKADTVKLNSEDAHNIQSFRFMNAHHARGLHLKYEKDDKDAATDFGDFVWTGPEQSKPAHVKSEWFTSSDSKLITNGIVGKDEDENSSGNDGKPLAAVPEPGTLLLLGAGLLIGGAAARKRIRVT